MHVHILGICGTFMGGLALIGRQLGFRVTGSDQNVYPPMSTQLEKAGIELYQGYDDAVLDLKPDQIVVGNVMTRGHGIIETMLQQGMPLLSGPAWLYQHVLHDRWVITASGTHGKTTTSSMIAAILARQGMNPGYLIGGVPNDFGQSADLGDSSFFVIEGDEYDTAFFDKRSKFLHYRPRTLVINNLEFDHADIFDDLRAIQKQFHHLIKVMPRDGKVIFNADDEAINELLSMGCWSESESFGLHGKADWHLFLTEKQGMGVQQKQTGKRFESELPFFGMHNYYNACAAVAACHHAGIAIDDSLNALQEFSGVKRRLEFKGEHNGVSVYDDFAHHPTEITATLSAFRQRYPERRIVAVFEPRSNSMQRGTHRAGLKDSFAASDRLYVLQSSGLTWQAADVFDQRNTTIKSSVDELLQVLLNELQESDCVLLLSNGGFGGLCDRLVNGLQTRI